MFKTLCFVFLVLFGLSFSKKVDASAAFECTLCQLVTSLTEDYISSESWNQTQILSEIEVACTYLPSQYQLLCNGFVQVYAQRLVEELTSGTDPLVICGEFGLCVSPNQEMKPSINLMNMMKKAQTETGTDIGCVVCNTAVNLLESWIKAEGLTTNGIVTKLLSFCSDLPSDYGLECQAMVYMAGNTFITQLVNGVPATQFCGQFGLCSSSDEPNIMEQKPKILISQ